MQGSFSSQNLADKLVKLNSTQQSIETLSHWCIFHRKYAKQVVDVWEKEFFRAPKEQRVPFLFLANDILQNSRRKGSEFVSEFWRVLSGALRLVMQNGDESSRNTVTRLIDIWEERRVFGSHAQGLRVELLGKDMTNARNSDAFMPEKLVAVYKAFQDKLTDEESLVEKCQTAILHMEAFEKDIDMDGIMSGQENAAIVLDELQHRESNLLECAQQLEATDIARSSIVFQLKETLRDQESKLERTRRLLQDAHAHTDQARIMQQQIYSCQTYNPALANGSAGGLLSDHHYDSSIQQHSGGPMTSVVSSLLSSNPSGSGSHETECYVPTEAKMFDPASAAEVSAKLMVSSASAVMISSVLSSLAAENALQLHAHGRVPQQGHHFQQQQQHLDPEDPVENYDREVENYDREAKENEEEIEEEGERDGEEPAEKRQKLDEGEESESLLGPAVELDDEFVEDDGASTAAAAVAAVVAGSASVSGSSPPPMAIPPPAVAAAPPIAIAAATTTMGFLDSSSATSSMLLPFSFGGQSLGFPLSVVAPPGCAPPTDQAAFTTASLFALPRQ